MAKKNNENPEELISGKQASEFFSLNQGYQLWMGKSKKLGELKSIQEWENFFKENKII